jgi:hypothetical protein
MSDEVRNFVSQLTAASPGRPHSVQLDLDVDGDVHGLFEFLLMTMTEMLKKWYEPPITIANISPSHLESMGAYFASFGYKLNLDIRESPRILHINNREYLNKSRLEDMKFSMAAGDRLYVVHFTYFPNM